MQTLFNSHTRQLSRVGAADALQKCLDNDYKSEVKRAIGLEVVTQKFSEASVVTSDKQRWGLIFKGMKLSPGKIRHMEVSVVSPEKQMEVAIKSKDIRKIVRLLVTFGPTNKEVAFAGCKAVADLANNDDNERKLGKIGACEAVVKAL
jgi:hypothetical protein